MLFILIADPNALDILTTDNEAYSSLQRKSVEAVPGGYACHDSIIFIETNAAYASVAENTYEECDVYINAEENINNLKSSSIDVDYSFVV